MNQCPKCGSYMTEKLICISSTPVIRRTCVCGYDSLNNPVYVTNNTNGLIRKEFQWV